MGSPPRICTCSALSIKSNISPLPFPPIIPHKGAVITRPLYLAAGWLSLALGALGVVLPILPTVPFVILAAFCFARSSPKLEAWLLANPTFGPHIIAWRDKGAISRKGKWAATAAFAFSIGMAIAFIAWPYWLAPCIAAVVTGSWIWSRPDGADPPSDNGDENRGEGA